MATSPRTSIVAAGRQRRSAVRYSNLEKATSSPILTKPNRNVEFDESIVNPSRCGVVAGMQGWRKTMEDRHALCTLPLGTTASSDSTASAPPATGPTLLAVFDGHRGTESAELCAGLLPRSLNDLFVSANHSLDVLLDKAKVTECFVEVDAALRRCWEDRSLSVSRASSLEPNASLCSTTGGGTTTPNDEASCSSQTTSLQSSPKELSVSTVRAPEIVITGSTANLILGCPASGYYCLNVGDSRGYLISKRTAQDGEEEALPTSTEESAESPKQLAALPQGVTTFALSKDHRTTAASEATRIEAAGGYIVNGRVNGKLSVTRALGDFDLKPNLLDPLDNPLICVPDVTFQPSPPASLPAIAQLQRRGTALFLDRAAGDQEAGGTLGTSYGSLESPEIVDYDVAVVGCDGVWELQTINDIAIRIDKKIVELLPVLRSEKPTDVESRGLVLEQAMREVIVDTLAHACAVNCDQTGGSLGADNMSLGVVLHLI